MSMQRVVRRYTWHVPVTIVLLAAGATVTAGKARAQSRPEPRSVEDVVRRYVQALGGEQALRSITSRRMVMVTRMKMADGQPDMESKAEHFYLAPDKFLMRMQMGPAGIIDMGVNGSLGWTASQFTEPEALDSVKTAGLRRAGQLVPSYGGTLAADFLGRRTLDGRAAFAVRFRADTSSPWATDYYDAESGLKVGTDIEAPPGMGPGAQMRYEDYRWVDRERVAMRTRMVSDGKTMAAIEVLKVEHAPLDTTLFMPPAALRKSRQR